MKNLFLRFPTLGDKENYINYQKEEHNIDIDYEKWLLEKEKQSQQEKIVDGKVPRTILLLTDDKNVIYGQVSIRYSINTPKLKQYIGHVGYEMRSKYRGQGLGNLILKLALIECQKIGINNVMISCKKNNILSAKVIEYNGGMFEREEFIEEENEYYKIYYIKI